MLASGQPGKAAASAARIFGTESQTENDITKEVAQAALDAIEWGRRTLAFHNAASTLEKKGANKSDAATSLQAIAKVTVPESVPAALRALT